jgi:hypothetical protein
MAGQADRRQDAAAPLRFDAIFVTKIRHREKLSRNFHIAEMHKKAATQPRNPH